jgi:hypothetical protein
MILDAQVEKMNQMKSELEVIASGELGNVKELPSYDNSQNVMNSLAFVLNAANQYSVNFSSVEIEASVLPSSSLITCT